LAPILAAAAFSGGSFRDPRFSIFEYRADLADRK